MIAVLPATSVDCERGFSNLSHIKIDNRSRLCGVHLESLIRITSTEMDELTMLDYSTELIKLWKRKKDRRMLDKGDTSRL